MKVGVSFFQNFFLLIILAPSKDDGAKIWRPFGTLEQQKNRTLLDFFIDSYSKY